MLPHHRLRDTKPQHQAHRCPACYLAAVPTTALGYYPVRISTTGRYYCSGLNLLPATPLREGCIIALASVIYHAVQDSTDELPTLLRKSILPTGGCISSSAHTHPGLTHPGQGLLAPTFFQNLSCWCLTPPIPAASAVGHLHASLCTMLLLMPLPCFLLDTVHPPCLSFILHGSQA